MWTYVSTSAVSLDVLSVRPGSAGVGGTVEESGYKTPSAVTKVHGPDSLQLISRRQKVLALQKAARLFSRHQAFWGVKSRPTASHLCRHLGEQLWSSGGEREGYRVLPECHLLNKEGMQELVLREPASFKIWAKKKKSVMNIYTDVDCLLMHQSSALITALTLRS